MMKCVNSTGLTALFALSFGLSLFWAAPFANGTETQASARSVHHESRGPDYFAQFSLLSSKSGQKNDFRNLKGLASDDNGGMSESTSIPNLNYAAAIGILKFQENHRLVLVGLQSLDNVEARTIPTPFRRNFVLPGQLLGFRYSYALDDSWRLTAGSAWIDVFKFTDPTAGLVFRKKLDGGIAYRLALDFSAPVNGKSKRDHLITRVTARSGAYLRRPGWSGYARLSHSVPYFSTEGSMSSGHGSGGTGGQPMPQFEEIDLVLADREISRTMTGLGASIPFTEEFSLSSGVGLTYLRTARGSDIWISNMKALGATYSFSQMELASNLTLNSDIQNYQRPSLPKLWAVDLTASYQLGRRPREM